MGRSNNSTVDNLEVILSAWHYASADQCLCVCVSVCLSVTSRNGCTYRHTCNFGVYILCVKGI